MKRITQRELTRLITTRRRQGYGDFAGLSDIDFAGLMFKPLAYRKICDMAGVDFTGSSFRGAEYRLCKLNNCNVSGVPGFCQHEGTGLVYDYENDIVLNGEGLCLEEWAVEKNYAPNISSSAGYVFVPWQNAQTLRISLSVPPPLNLTSDEAISVKKILSKKVNPKYYGTVLPTPTNPNIGSALSWMKPVTPSPTRIPTIVEAAYEMFAEYRLRAEQEFLIKTIQTL